MTKFYKGDLICYLSEIIEEKIPRERYTFGIILERPVRSGQEVISNILDNQGKIYEVYLDHHEYGPVEIVCRYKRQVQ
jgi:hypothetical protein